MMDEIGTMEPSPPLPFSGFEHTGRQRPVIAAVKDKDSALSGSVRTRLPLLHREHGNRDRLFEQVCFYEGAAGGRDSTVGRTARRV